MRSVGNENEEFMKLVSSRSAVRRISSTARSCSASRARPVTRSRPTRATADVIVVNTCAFIDTAKEESVNAILEMAQLKRDGGCKRLVVTGCLAERYRDQLKAEIPEIDVVLGTGEVPEIVGALNGSQPTAACPCTLFRSASEAARPRAQPANADDRSRRTARADVSLRRVDAAAADDAEALRLRESRRRLRLHVRVLHHPDAAREVPQPRRGLDRRRGRTARGAAASASCC